MANAGGGGGNRSRILFPQARQGLEQIKFETAQELGIGNYQGYLGDLPSRTNGYVGGYMVRRMIQLAEQQIANGTTPPAASQTGDAAQGGISGVSAQVGLTNVAQGGANVVRGGATR
ncbi:MAG: small, acid-soluble spore protein, alpha/beta type [Ignavibacteriales bacterium]